MRIHSPGKEHNIQQSVVCGFPRSMAASCAPCGKRQERAVPCGRNARTVEFAWCWKARDRNMDWHVLAGATRWETLLPLGVQGLGQSTQRLGEKSSMGLLGILIFLWSVELMAGFPQQLFLECFWFPWNSASAPASAAWQAPTCCPRKVHKGSWRQQHPCTAKTSPSLFPGWK